MLFFFHPKKIRILNNKLITLTSISLNGLVLQQSCNNKSGSYGNNLSNDIYLIVIEGWSQVPYIFAQCSLRLLIVFPCSTLQLLK